MRIRPARRISGRLSLPGDKSISHRAAIIASLATGESSISNFATSADCAATLSCLRQLGVSIESQSEHGPTLRLTGVGQTGLQAAKRPLDCGNSGSTLRMLAGVLAGQNLTTTLTGDSSLQARPMGRVIEPLREMGARVDSRDGKPPITISGTNELRAINYALPVASAQVKSCLMLAGLLAHGRTEVSEPLGVTRDHTERMMKWFGIPLETEVTSDVAAGPRIGVVGPVSFAARDVSIPGDISSAAFLIAAAALLPRSDVVIEDVGLNPTRTQFLATLRSLGLAFEVTSEREKCNEPIGTLRVTGATLTAAEARPVIVGGAAIAQLIDELPLLAVVGSQTDGGIEIREASELRLKESDRIAATVKNLRAMGAMVEETADGMLVGGPTQLHGAVIDSYGDHRIAMAFSVAALLASGESEIEGAECVSVSFPEFFNLLESIVER